MKKKKERLLELLGEGFFPVETKGAAEVLRIKNDGATITLYKNGKVLVQGKDKERWKDL